MAKSIKRNYIYNLSYQIFSIIAPFITSPYIARVLGPENAGIFSFISTYVSYFVLFGRLSIDLYGTRELSYVKDDITKKSEIFWNLALLNFLNLLIAIGIYLAWFFIYKPDNGLFYIVSLLAIVSGMLDITWLFSAHEDFGMIALRNFIVRIISIVLLFVFVRSSGDLLNYFLINLITPLVINVSMLRYVKKYATFVKPTFSNAYKNFPKVVKISLPNLAVSVYTMLDKLLLGAISGNEYLGYYDYSKRIVGMALTIVSSMTPIMMVRMSGNFKNKDLSSVRSYVAKSFKFSVFSSVLIFSLLISVVPEFIPWFYGQNFSSTIILIQILSPTIVAVAMGTVAGHQFLLSVGKENLLSFALMIGATISFLLNILLIPRYHALGASLTSLITEVAVTTILYIIISKYVRVKALFTQNYKFFVFSLAVIAPLRIIGTKMGPSVVTNMVQTVVGTIIYLVLSFVFDKDIRSYIYNMLRNLRTRFGNYES
ncbi:MAG TPA: flippase [Fervidobacterium sp.]|nr:flippase [Fervidobacterium sp.]